jgi:hypothetical protein
MAFGMTGVAPALWIAVLVGLGCAGAMATGLAADATPQHAAQIIRVGPGREVAKVADAARIARDGDVVEIDAGEYVGDVASWAQDNIAIRGVGGRARMAAGGASAEGKAIWVIKGTGVVVEAIEFSGARVPDHNGAGIRHEGGRLTVRNCLFERNEMGLLTSNLASSELTVESSEFRDNAVSTEHRPGDPIGHQIYVGSIARFTLRDSYVHRGAFGHLVKTRAKESNILYNRITDEDAGRASYELEFPNGGIAYVIGNIIEQGRQTENRDMISFGAEGYRWPRNELIVASNTLVDDAPRNGEFVRARDGADRVALVDNLFIGSHGLNANVQWESIGNAEAAPADVPLAAGMDYRLAAGSALVGTAVNPGWALPGLLPPEREYVHPRQSRALSAGRRSPGALQSVVP